MTVLTIDRPEIAGPRYSLKGQIQYEGIEGTGYLEMWNHFPDGSQYFSRTLAENGPMMKLHGSSPWRPFVLPFDASGAPTPTRLVFNLVLEGRGIVYLGPLELTDLNTADSSGMSGDSVSRVAGMAGGIAGAVVGCVGALIGLLTSLGRARRFVIALAMSLIAVGATSFIAGLTAFGGRSPTRCSILSCSWASSRPSFRLACCPRSGGGTRKSSCERCGLTTSAESLLERTGYEREINLRSAIDVR